jgi:hypothetical protein
VVIEQSGSATICRITQPHPRAGQRQSARDLHALLQNHNIHGLRYSGRRTAMIYLFGLDAIHLLLPVSEWRSSFWFGNQNRSVDV